MQAGLILVSKNSLKVQEGFDLPRKKTPSFGLAIDGIVDYSYF